MTRDEFVAAYAERLGISVEDVQKWRTAIPAALDFPQECGYEDCEGWHMIPRSELAWEIERGMRSEACREYLEAS